MIHKKHTKATKKEIEYFRKLNAEIIKTKTYRLESNLGNMKIWVADFIEQNKMIERALEIGYPIARDEISHLIELRLARLEHIKREESE